MSLDFLPSLTDTLAGQRPATAGTRAYHALRQAIIQLQLRPGYLLSETEVARQLGVSRQPVREAFIKLAEVGLLEVRPQRGTIVKLISIRDVGDARFLREAIELAVVRQATSDASTRDLADLDAIIAAQRALGEGDNVAFLRLDEAFHQRLARSAGREHAWRVLENLKAQMDRVRFLSLPDATPLETIVAQHARILEGVRRREAAVAEAAMREHLSEIFASIPKLAAQHPDLFTQ